jgi:DNA polymerase I-like protein with 3'-5' exonuclease and polymerase domains
MLSEGKNAWLKLVRNNRIHHNCSVSTNTHRCAHRNPNLAQVPSDLSFRKLFCASPGYVMVGADLAGIELRMLAHYLARYDGGRYGDVLLNGDIHQENADKIGISRRLVKTVTYAFLYGAGDQKIGLSYDQSLPPNKAKEKGAEIRAAYVAAIDGLDKLLAAVRTAGERGSIKSIDGRKIAVDSPHKALNYLLQSGAGVVAKRWMVIANHGLVLPNTNQLAFIHDELQWETEPSNADVLKDWLEASAVRAGEYYNLRIPIAAEGKTGSTWADVH